MKKQISVHLVGQTSINRKTMLEWIRTMGFDKYELPKLDPSTGVTPSALLIMAAAKQCYAAFDVGVNLNLTKVRTDLAQYLENILASGHGSVLEHATFSFAIEGCTRVLTAEMNRHRAGTAISERSMRYVRMDELHYWEPDSIQDDNKILAKLGELFGESELKVKKAQTRIIFGNMFRHAEAAIARLVNIWQIEKLEIFKEKKLLTSMFRRCIPMGVSTGGIWTFNVRALRHILTSRGSEHAEEEIFHVADLVADTVTRLEPLLFGDFHRDEQGCWRPKHVKV